MVCHRTLVELIQNTPLAEQLLMWPTSHHHFLQLWSSPELSSFTNSFLFFFRPWRASVPENVRLTSYADDFHPSAQSLDFEAASRWLNGYLHHILIFFTCRKIVIASSKPAVTWFLSYNKDFNKMPRLF